MESKEKIARKESRERKEAEHGEEGNSATKESQ
jgi:hypothetical protein